MNGDLDARLRALAEKHSTLMGERPLVVHHHRYIYPAYPERHTVSLNFGFKFLGIGNGNDRESALRAALDQAEGE